jgi:hypothetical protein
MIDDSELTALVLQEEKTFTICGHPSPPPRPSEEMSTREMYETMAAIMQQQCKEHQENTYYENPHLREYIDDHKKLGHQPDWYSLMKDYSQTGKWAHNRRRAWQDKYQRLVQYFTIAREEIWSLWLSKVAWLVCAFVCLFSGFGIGYLFGSQKLFPTQLVLFVVVSVVVAILFVAMAYFNLEDLDRGQFENEWTYAYERMRSCCRWKRPSTGDPIVEDVEEEDWDV